MLCCLMSWPQFFNVCVLFLFGDQKCNITRILPEWKLMTYNGNLFVFSSRKFISRTFPNKHILRTRVCRCFKTTNMLTTGSGKAHRKTMINMEWDRANILKPEITQRKMRKLLPANTRALFFFVAPSFVVVLELCAFLCPRTVELNFCLCFQVSKVKCDFSITGKEVLALEPPVVLC